MNAEGGILLKSLGKRVPLEVIEYDDHSNADEAVAAVYRLVTEDKVDFILAPWGTGLNLAVGPLLHDAGYPQLAVTAVTDRAPELGKLWPNSFWLLGTTSGVAQGLVDTLSNLRAEGKVGNKVAMVNVADQLGIELSRAGRLAFKKAKFELVYNRPYPIDPQDVHGIVTEVMKSTPDVFVAFSYPPDTMKLTEESRTLSFNPKVFYAANGTSYPFFRDHFGKDAEGVMGAGGWNPDTPESRTYVKHHMEMTGRGPNSWGSPVAYASLQMLHQAIERVGKIDRPAVIKELQSGTFQTVIGPVKLEDNLRKDVWWLGQWQDGGFYGLAPSTLPGARKARVPKPAWLN